METRFNKWIYATLPNRKPKLVIAYNFNIAETGTQYLDELIGSREYDADNEDWACREAWTSRPKIFKIAKKDCGDWQAALETVQTLVAQFIRSNQTLLNDATAVCVGFVDGNLVRVWPTGA